MGRPHQILCGSQDNHTRPVWYADSVWDTLLSSIACHVSLVVIGFLDDVAFDHNTKMETGRLAMKGPKTLDELIWFCPGVGTMRQMGADLLRTLLNRQRKECTWCGKRVPKGRSKWCSDECVDQFNTRCSPQYAKNIVERRDGFICQICGRDIKKCKRIWKHVNGYLKAVRLNGSRYGERCDPLDCEAAAALGFGRGGWHEVDHIIPVVEGGGLCPIENLRTVCGACHSDVTNALAKRRKKVLP